MKAPPFTKAPLFRVKGEIAMVFQFKGASPTKQNVGHGLISPERVISPGIMRARKSHNGVTRAPTPSPPCPGSMIQENRPNRRNLYIRYAKRNQCPKYFGRKCNYQNVLINTVLRVMVRFFSFFASIFNRNLVLSESFETISSRRNNLVCRNVLIHV